MFVAIFDIDRNAVATVIDVSADITRKVFDFDVCSFKGFCDSSIEGAQYGIAYDDNNEYLYSGTIRDLKQENGLISFKLDDWRRLLDVDLLLDFSQSTPDLSLGGIFAKVFNVFNAERLKDAFISKIPIITYAPSDATDTTFIANYTHEYIIVNAWKFLKVYLAYYGYALFASWGNNVIYFDIEKRSDNVTTIYLDDFIFDAKKTSTATNKTIATIKYEKNIIDMENYWGASNITTYNNADAGMKGTGASLPSIDGLPIGYVFRKVITTGYMWETTTSTVYDNAYYKVNGPLKVPFCRMPLLSDATSVFGSASDYQVGTAGRVSYYTEDGEFPMLCYPSGYFRTTASVSYEYYIVTDGGTSYQPRPSLVEKVYLLGNDNQIYANTLYDYLRIYPVKQKYFEATFLSEAQFNAVQELVSSRYDENIFLKEQFAPIDIRELKLNDLVEVYDSENNLRTLPVAEITIRKEAYEVKLGFKKQLFTEIVML